MKIIKVTVSLLAIVSLSGCKWFGLSDEAKKSSESKPMVFWNKTGELRGHRFGLAKYELALTLDDGPSIYTAGLARFLKAKSIPGVFFMNYKNGPHGISEGQGLETLKEICAMKIHSIGNHTDFHMLGSKENKTLGRTWEYIQRTHEVIKQNCPAKHYFFRSPGGNWNGEEEALNKNAQLDRDGIPLGDMYVGPVYWDYGGQEPAADWDDKVCQKDINKCRDAYADDVLSAEGLGGIVLVHDIYPTTMELLMGKNWRELLKDPNASDGADGFLVRMQKMGYKFVSLDSHSDAINALLTGSSVAPAPVAAAPQPAIKTSPAEPTQPTSVDTYGLIEAKVGTWLKKKHADSSSLAESEKCFVRPRERFAITSKVEASAGHYKVAIRTAYKAEACHPDFWNQAEYFVFAAHFTDVK